MVSPEGLHLLNEILTRLVNIVLPTRDLGLEGVKACPGSDFSASDFKGLGARHFEGPRRWDLTVTPMIPGQELDLAFRYWEGAVRVRGTGEGGAPVRGRGYVELTGYAGRAPAR